MASSTVFVAAAILFFVLACAMAWARWRGSCHEALWAAYISAAVSVAMFAAAGAMLNPRGTPMEEAMWLCWRADDCDLVRLAEALNPLAALSQQAPE